MNKNELNTGYTFSVLGLDINFPYEPYGIQKAMMNHVTRALKNRQHSLIESPTGTGKTLVLLCSSLAWQQKSINLKRPFLSNKLSEASTSNEQASDEGLDENNNNNNLNITDQCMRIYYGIRTHKQITQVIKELRKTSYDNSSIRICILSGRERACINDSIRCLSTRDERCHEFVSARLTEMKFPLKRIKRRETCRFYCDSRSIARTFQGLANRPKVWDIEDAVEFGRENCACPYYGMRALHDRATITFCPYNYLIDPAIRKGLNIELENAVVVFDEAHNIDDVCRNSASFIISLKQVTNFTKSIGSLVAYYERQGQTNVVCGFNYFAKIFRAIGDILVEAQFDTQLRQSSISIGCDEMQIKLQKIGLGRDCLLILKNHLKNLSHLCSAGNEAGTQNYCSQQNEDNNRSQEYRPPPQLDFESTRLINQLAVTIDLMYEEGSSVEDYKLVVQRSIEQTQPSGVFGRGLAAVGIVSGKVVKEFKLLCMNPALIFKQVHQSAWSIIVASGTLAPISSVKTELGCKFTNVFEGSHVVREENIFASVIATGPNGLPLNGCYANSLQLRFQDELGIIVGNICATVPNGVLCFFPSYDRMDKLFARWQQVGLMTSDVELKSGKRIFREQKNISPIQFERSLAGFYRHANDSTAGALLLAVYRGKVSEGVDFADRAGRAVITIGIPYPSFCETSVALKRAYNDRMRLSNSSLLSGREWYDAQAFRALNQALGRCIRHSRDWGAIIMLDSRLQTNASRNNITKWIRTNIIEETDHNSVIDKLHRFIVAHSETG